MNLIWHQFRTDCRAQRWPLIIFILFAVSLPILNTLANRYIEDIETSEVIGYGLLTALFLLASVPLVLTFSSTPFVGSNGFWPTRPLSRRMLFWSKSLWIIICILTPCVIVIYRSLDYLMLTTPQQMTVSTMTSMLFLAVLGVIISLRAASENLQQFFVFVTLSLGILALSAFGLGSFHYILMKYGVVMPYLNGNPLLSITCFLIFCSAASWLFTAHWRKTRLGLGVMFAGIALIPWTSFTPQLQLTQSSTPPVLTFSSSLVNPNSVLDPRNPDELLLWNNVLIRGLAQNQIVIPHQGSIEWQSSYQNRNQQINLSLTPYFDNGDLNSIISPKAMWDRISTGYPETTKWDRDEYHQNPAHRQLSVSNDHLAGNIKLSLKTTVYECIRRTSLPCRKNAKSRLLHGGSIKVAQLQLNQGNLDVRLNLSYPSENLTGEPIPDELKRRHRFQKLPMWIVLYHPNSHRAIATQSEYRIQGLPATMVGRSTNRASLPIPQLEISLQGLTPEQWLAECEIHIHGIRATGVFHPPLLKQDNYRLHPNTANWHRPSSSTSGTSQFKQAKLPPHPTLTEIESYLDTVIYQAPMHNTELLNEKFKSLPTQGIIELAKRIPTHRIADDRIFNFLRKQSHKLPDQIIIDGLKRDDRFIWLCLKHKLDDQILPWLITRLHKRHPLGNSTKIIIELVCKKATLTPELKADLHWHFVHTDSYTQQQAIAGMLEKLPGFDFISAINDAWILAKLNENHPYSIAPFAVQLGDKEALRHTLVAIKHSNQPNSPKHTKQDLVERLQPSLQTKLPADQAANWAAKHYTRLIFNPDTRKFHLP